MRGPVSDMVLDPGVRADDRGGSRIGVQPFGDDQASRLRAMVARLAPAHTPDPPRAARTKPVVAITSGKGGVGKTTAGVNLAIALTRMGLRTTLVDADLGLANADVMCGLNPGRRLDQVLADPRGGLERISVEAPGGFRLVPGAAGVARAADLAPAELTRLLDALTELERSSDLTLVDTGAGIGRSVLSMVGAADLAVVVVTPEPTSITDSYALIKCVRKAQTGAAPAINVLINQTRGDDEAREVYARLSGCCAKFLGGPALGFLGWVPQDAAVPAAVRARSPVMLDRTTSPAARHLVSAARTLAAKLDLPIRDETDPSSVRRGIFGRWLGLRK